MVWAVLGIYVGGLGQLWGPMLAVSDRSWGLCWRSWSALGAFVGDLGPLLGLLFALLGPLGIFVARSGPSWVCSSVLCWRYWAAFGAFVGSLGCSWGLCGRSWADKCAKHG